MAVIHPAKRQRRNAMRIDRRTFLQCIVVTAGPLAAACRGDDSSDEGRDASLAEEGSQEGGAEGGEAGPAPQDGHLFFPQSVASGDPQPDGVVLWTRIVDDALPSGDRALTVEIAADEAFSSVVARQSDLPALLANDNVLKVKVVGLVAKTVYFYRFIYEKDGAFASRTGRTKTAPTPDDDAQIRFAIGNCQDFVGRYYNSWQYFTQLAPDLDFIVFLGDYIYETNGDPSYQATGSARTVTFSDPAATLPLAVGGVTFSAAQSLSNYRDLYKIYRSDAFLQKVHERYAFVFVWDDHEYSDDCHGATATYTNGRTDETNVPRRQNAERAFFEYAPFDPPDTGQGSADQGAIDPSALPVYPMTRIYRDLVFGKNVRLLVADYRTYRPDHLIPEDAYPGAVVMDQAALAATHLDTAFASDTFAYVDIDEPAYATTKLLLSIAYQQLAATAGLDQAAAQVASDQWVKGNVSLVYANAVLAAIQFPPIDPAGKPRGLAWVHMGKRDLFASQGSRYIVVKDTLDAYAAYRYAVTSGASEDAYGQAQEAWLAGALSGPETWKVLVSSVSITSLIFDLRDKMDIPDATLRNRYYLDADMWDGFPTRRQQLLAALAAAPSGKAMVVCGDIHAAFASVEGGIPCLTSPAISSQTVKNGARTVAVAAGFDETSAVYQYVVTDIDATFQASNPQIVFSDTDSNGFLIVEIGAAGASATYYLLSSAETQTDYSTSPSDLTAKIRTRTFQIAPGSITG
jgi:alkaline phosphatase D